MFSHLTRLRRFSGECPVETAISEAMLSVTRDRACLWNRLSSHLTNLVHVFKDRRLWQTVGFVYTDNEDIL